MVSRGAFHHWQQLPHGWDNAHLATAQPVSLGSFQPGQPPVKSVRQLTTAEKLAHAIYLANDYVGEEAQALLEELTSPSASLIAFEAVYTISLFFGVGELVTGLAVILGVIFVGEVVLDIIGSLVSFVKLATNATDEAGLRAAAKELAHALTLGAAIVTAIVLHKAVTKFKPGNVPENVVRSGGGGKKKPLKPTPAEVKPAEPKKPTGISKGKIEIDPKREGHIFREDEGHIPDTPANRRRLEDVANKKENSLGTDKRGNEWYAETQPDGSQTWVSVRDGKITNGGVNNPPRTFNPGTGLSAPVPPGHSPKK